MPDPAVRLSRTDHDWLVELLSIPSVTPLEGGDPSQVRAAQDLFAAGVRHRGFDVLLDSAPSPDILSLPGTPAQVRAAAGSDPASFLRDQPSVVAVLGGDCPPERTIVANFHIDTVGPHLPISRQGDLLYGRGAVDAKGPGIALVAGVRAAFDRHPHLLDDVRVVITAVPGEEGGAMGVYGTRWLVESGIVGRLMLFAEPTDMAVLDACSATMTPRLSVVGDDSTDDHPEQGHNATLALGFLATLIAERLGPAAARHKAKLTIAGLHTGQAHNRVYGEGDLRLNIAYFDEASADALADELTELVDDAHRLFAERFGENPVTRRLVEDWQRVVRFEWLKHGLPPLNNRDQTMERVLADAGLYRRDGVADGTAFTCDAIWAAGPGRYAAVCGPGSLDRNGAHTPREWIDLRELDAYATRISDLVVAFAKGLP